jgi:hypothetical protein
MDNFHGQVKYQRIFPFSCSSNIHAFGLTNRAVTFEHRFLFLETEHRAHRGAPEVKCENVQKIQHNEERVM